MKRCPVCQTVYEDRVDFCFEDGSPLEEYDASADPTALPSGLDAPERPVAAKPVAASKKSRGRGMFARPSVADMLSLPEPGVVPPAGGHRVAPSAASAEVAPSKDESAAVVAPPTNVSDVPVGSPPSDYTDPEAETLIYDRDTLNTEIDELDEAADTIINEPDETADTVIDEPDDAVFDVPDVNVPAFEEATDDAGLADDVVPFPSSPPSIDVPPARIDVPVSAEAVEVPGTEDSFEDSFDAPPGLEDPAAVSLDDSWFGAEDDLDVPGAGDDDDAIDSIEDPGFADVAQSGDVGFDDSSWAADGASRGDSSAGGTNKAVMGIGALLLLAAAVFAGVMIIPGDDAEPVAEAPTVKPAPVSKVLPPPAPEEPSVPDDAAVDAEDAAEKVPEDEVKEEVPETDAERDVPVVVPAVVERVEAEKPEPKPAAATPPKAAKAAKANTPKVAKAAKAATVAPQTPWTGASTTTAAPAQPAASGNPWGAPVETASRGRMTITTEPLGAMVYVDGRRIGKSPTRTEVTYGTHKVRVELNDYKASSRVVNVQVAEVAVPFRLETATMMGRCNLLGPMGSSVSMDGKSVGRVPTTVSCSPGPHRFTVTPKDGAPFTVSKTVVIAGPNESVAVQLFPG